jgi:hypothetical protein
MCLREALQVATDYAQCSTWFCCCNEETNAPRSAPRKEIGVDRWIAFVTAVDSREYQAADFPN